MKKLAMMFPLVLMIALLSVQVSAFAWCTPRILQCGDVIDSSTVHYGHDDISRYSCTGTTNWYGNAHVYKITHLGDSLRVQLDWTGNSNHALGVFILSDCNATHCLAYNAHTIATVLSPGTYWIIVDSRTDYGNSYRLTITCGDHNLPVELLSFTATDAPEGVNLDWSTASETRSASFRIERQLQDTEDWTVVGSVNAQGESVARTDYHFVDTNAGAGLTYAYRLISVDLGGQSSELQLVVTSHSAPAAAAATEFRLIGNYPNPFNPSTHIAFETLDTAPITLQVFDVSGRLVQTLASGTFSAGVHEATFDASNLPSGIYFARLQGAQINHSIKMVLMK
jgi:hypothetical protein